MRKLGIYFIALLLMVSVIFIDTGVESYASTENLIPAMTSNTSPSGVASASSFADNLGYVYEPYTAFNQQEAHGGVGGKDNYWASLEKEAWLAYEFPEAEIVNKYTITNDYSLNLPDAEEMPERFPRDWTFEGFNESTNQWDILDTRTGESGWTYNVKKEYTFSNSKAYKKYRINITENNGYSQCTTIGEMEMMRVEMPVPDTPTNLTATAGDSEVELSWDSATDADSYNIYRATTSGGPYTTVAEEVYGTSYTDTDVTNGTTYYYAVTAVNTDGESDSSDEASATPVTTSNGDKALLRITMINGTINEYDLSMDDVDTFIEWYEDRGDGNGDSYYLFSKDYNVGPFVSRTDYIAFDKILQFEVMEYTE